MPLVHPAVEWDNGFVDNRNGTCWGQCLVWLKLRRAGKELSAPSSLEDSLNNVVSSNVSQRTVVYAGVKKKCTSTTRKDFDQDGKFLDSITWSGTYKIIVIEAGDGAMHAIALMSPWIGSYEVFDPNQGVYKAKNWSDIKNLLLQFTGHDPGSNKHWFFQGVLTVPNNLL